VLRELGLSFSYADGSGYKVLALLIDPPGTIIGPEGGWGAPTHICKDLHFNQKSKKKRLGDPTFFFLHISS
jgi:hypothetical protein